MIENRIKQVAQARGLKTPYEFQRALDLTPAVAWRMWHKKTSRWSEEVLEKLCAGLECQVGELLVYVPEKKPRRRRTGPSGGPRVSR